ncbi:COP9 signalosome complex subunit 6 [Phlyctochytrium planicorne]|nr:COP9 signalosome complex subunit 6 [Phlyctochytrium planicorne]
MEMQDASVVFEGGASGLSITLYACMQALFGAVIGTQNGRDIEIFNSYELPFTTSGNDVTIDKNYFLSKQEQFRQVFPKYDMLGWYTVGVKPTKSDVHVHQQFLDINESPLFLQLNPLIVAASKDLPIHMYESVIDIVAGQPQMKFVESSFTIETGEAERIAVDHVAHLTNAENAAESTLINHLGTQRNAIKMLQTRIKVLSEYISDVEKGVLPRDHTILREISSLRDRLPTMTGSDFQREFQIDFNDVLLTTYLTSITKGTNQLNDLIEKILKDAEDNVKRFQQYDDEYQSVETFLTNVHKTTKVKYKVQLSKLAFMMGELIHTNEVIVSLGDNWFVERSNTQALEIVKRRREYTQELIRYAESQLKDLKLRFSITSDMVDEDGHALNEEGLRFVDIREAEGEETDFSAVTSVASSNAKGKERVGELGEFERKMLAKLQQYEEAGDGEDGEEEASDESHSQDDEDEDYKRDDLSDRDAEEEEDDDVHEYEEEDIVETRQVTKTVLPPTSKQSGNLPVIRTPADIYNRMKALSSGDLKEDVSKAKRQPQGVSKVTMQRQVMEKEVTEYTESDLEDYLMQKELIEEYVHKRNQIYDNGEGDNEEDENDGTYPKQKDSLKFAETSLDPEKELLFKDMLQYYQGVDAELYPDYTDAVVPPRSPKIYEIESNDREVNAKPASTLKEAVSSKGSERTVHDKAVSSTEKTSPRPQSLFKKSMVAQASFSGDDGPSKTRTTNIGVNSKPQSAFKKSISSQVIERVDSPPVSSPSFTHPVVERFSSQDSIIEVTGSTGPVASKQNINQRSTSAFKKSMAVQKAAQSEPLAAVDAVEQEASNRNMLLETRSRLKENTSARDPTSPQVRERETSPSDSGRTESVNTEATAGAPPLRKKVSLFKSMRNQNQNSN